MLLLDCFRLLWGVEVTVSSENSQKNAMQHPACIQRRQLPLVSFGGARLLSCPLHPKRTAVHLFGNWHCLHTVGHGRFGASNLHVAACKEASSVQDSQHTVPSVGWGEKAKRDEKFRRVIRRLHVRLAQGLCCRDETVFRPRRSAQGATTDPFFPCDDDPLSR